MYQRAELLSYKIPPLGRNCSEESGEENSPLFSRKNICREKVRFCWILTKRVSKYLINCYKYIT